jgi:hypothetical protein
MHSESVTIGERSVEVAVGCALKSASKPIEIPESLIGAIDAALKRDADRIASTVSAQKTVSRSSRSGLSVDGFQVVDRDTQEVLEQGSWLLLFFLTASLCRNRAWSSMFPMAACTQLRRIAMDGYPLPRLSMLVVFGGLGVRAQRGFCVRVSLPACSATVS